MVHGFTLKLYTIVYVIIDIDKQLPIKRTLHCYIICVVAESFPTYPHS